MGLAAYYLLVPVKKLYIKGLNLMTFATWLIKEKGFSSLEQYNSLVNKLPYESRRKLILYYKIEYKYYLDSRPTQLEFEMK